MTVEFNKKIRKHELLVKKAQRLKAKTCWICGKQSKVDAVEFEHTLHKGTHYHLHYKCIDDKCNGVDDFFEVENGKEIISKKIMQKIIIATIKHTCMVCGGDMSITDLETHYVWSDEDDKIHNKVILFIPHLECVCGHRGTLKIEDVILTVNQGIDAIIAKG